MNDPEDGYGINGVLGNNIEKSKLDINNGNAHYQRREVRPFQVLWKLKKLI